MPVFSKGLLCSRGSSGGGGSGSGSGSGSGNGSGSGTNRRSFCSGPTDGADDEDSQEVANSSAVVPAASTQGGTLEFETQLKDPAEEDVATLLSTLTQADMQAEPTVLLEFEPAVIVAPEAESTQPLQPPAASAESAQPLRSPAPPEPKSAQPLRSPAPPEPKSAQPLRTPAPPEPKPRKPSATVAAEPAKKRPAAKRSCGKATSDEEEATTEEEPPEFLVLLTGLLAHGPPPPDDFRFLLTIHQAEAVAR